MIKGNTRTKKNQRERSYYGIYSRFITKKNSLANIFILKKARKETSKTKYSGLKKKLMVPLISLLARLIRKKLDKKIKHFKPIFIDTGKNFKISFKSRLKMI